MFSLFNLAFENQSDYRSIDEMRYDLTIVSGYYEEHVNLITGEIFKKAKSISVYSRTFLSAAERKSLDGENRAGRKCSAFS